MEDSSISFIACHECDLLLREIALEPGEPQPAPAAAPTLYRPSTDSNQSALALAAAAALLFLIANIYPIFGIESQEMTRLPTCMARSAPVVQKMHFISTLVFITAIVVPPLNCPPAIYLLLP